MNHELDELIDKAIEKKADEPPKYTVVIHNDDWTPVIFVEELLMRVFSLSHEQASQVTMDIHEKGKGNVGSFTREIAECKSMQINKTAQHFEHPLLSGIEKL